MEARLPINYRAEEYPFPPQKSPRLNGEGLGPVAKGTEV